MMLDPLAKLIEEDLSLNVSQSVFGVVDERFDPNANIYKAITQQYSKFYFTIANRGGSFIDTSPHLESLEEMADWYNTKLQYYIEKTQTSDNGEMLAVLGMGPDGHTAGIFPYPEKMDWFNEMFVSTNKYAVGYDATGKNEFTKRFTMTFHALDTMTQLCAYVVGENKKEKLTEALTSEKTLAELPALYLQTAVDRLTLFTDIRNDTFGGRLTEKNL